MSYLSYPRINFYGRFFTDPSTVNNDPTHYEVDNTVPSPWQNPKGLHKFQLQDCSIVSTIGKDGEIQDPILGLPFITTDQPSAAKIADIDVYQQGVPTIYGMEVSIPISDSISLTGLIDPAVLNQLWWVSVLATRSWQDADYQMDSFGGDMNASGVYQSIIRVPFSSWPSDEVSPVLKELKSRTLQENGNYLVSIRFVVDGYRNVPEDKQYQTGRITGSLGPVFANEPLYSPGVRILNGRPQDKSDPWHYPMFNNCPFTIDEERKFLILDLANGICRKNAGGPPVDLGTLTAWIKPDHADPILIGEVDYLEYCFNTYSHIVQIPLSDDQITALNSSALSLQISRTDIGPSEIFVEDITPVNIEVEVRPIRLEGSPGSVATTKVYVSRLGKPVPGKKLGVQIVSVHGNTPGATVPPSNPGNTPQAFGAIDATITETDSLGFATVSIVVLKDPGFRTPQLDGQLYFINLYDADYPVPSSISQSAMISCLAWSDYKVKKNPKWEDVQDILAPYVKLFPGMTEKINLIDFKSFEVFAKNPPWNHMYGPNTPPSHGIKAGAIGFFMTRDENDTRYMPVTRDLSKAKRDTVLNFIFNLQNGTATGPNNQES
ncbi:hypothetical protein JYB62_13900 [Algoriphagus lutimaris]|uniref:hypothetical protein n=1 Tax=Algoriphagus lutimaris TaxID=613197 RepID=UPI00196ACDF0|nr:hypothetical protein [Algoriphagus lutimaris]MBN3521099.1 hypothetical protein [Algoriphagus lutimaris]